MPVRPALVSAPAGRDIHEIVLHPSSAERLFCCCSRRDLPHDSNPPDERRHPTVICGFRCVCSHDSDRHLLRGLVVSGKNFRPEKDNSQNQTEMFCIKT